MDRITRTDVDRIAATVSESFTSGLRVEAQGRNGYTALDLCDAHGTIENLHVGTKREVYTYLQGMRRTLLILNRTND
jgi:hypothetical protein